MALHSQHSEIKEEDRPYEAESAKSVDNDSQSSTGSYHSAAAHAGPPIARNEVSQQARQPQDTLDDYGNEHRITNNTLHAPRHTIHTGLSRTWSTKPYDGEPVPCSCIEPLRCCQCLGTGYVRPCASCAGVDCDDCAGVRVVPAFPAQQGVDVRDVLDRRDAPPGLDMPHQAALASRIVAARDPAWVSKSRDEPRRPSLRDIVLSRDRESQGPPTPQLTLQVPQHSQHQPYYIQTPETLTLVLDGPRATDYELDLPSLFLDRPLLPPLPITYFGPAAVHFSGWDSPNRCERDEQAWDIFSATRDAPDPSPTPTARSWHGQVRDWLEDVDEDGPIPDEYKQ